MDRIRILEACRRDRMRLAKAYCIGRVRPSTVELLPVDEPQPSASDSARRFDASPYLDHLLFGLLPLGWHAATNDCGVVLLQCEPEPGELLIEAANLIERMAAGKEDAPADWSQLSNEQRADLLAIRLLVEPDTAGLIAQRVMWRLARLHQDDANTESSGR
jgi:hypothetical protein